MAFPQEELLDASSGAAFFAEQTCTAVAVDRQNATGGNGQLRTRVQAFVESLEIKQLQAQRGGK